METAEKKRHYRTVSVKLNAKTTAKIWERSLKKLDETKVQNT